MENTLSAIIIIFLLLFGALTLSQETFSAQENLAEAWHTVQDVRLDTLNTRFRTITTHADPAAITLTLLNDGSTNLTNFDRWDLIVSYYDPLGDYHVEYLPYAATPTPGAWSVTGIYLDAALPRDEVFDRGIWNPGEELVVLVRQAAALGIGEAMQAVLAAPGGITLSIQAARNAPPELVTNTPLTVQIGQSITLSQALLRVTDLDDPTDELIYTVISAPLTGVLIPPQYFSQAQLDAGLVSYTHTGTTPGLDSFQFTVSDGEAVIGPFTFSITVEA